MADRELTMEDYLAMAKRRLRVVLIPALAVSYTHLDVYKRQSQVRPSGRV